VLATRVCSRICRHRRRGRRGRGIALWYARGLRSSQQRHAKMKRKRISKNTIYPVRASFPRPRAAVSREFRVVQMSVDDVRSIITDIFSRRHCPLFSISAVRRLTKNTCAPHTPTRSMDHRNRTAHASASHTWQKISRSHPCHGLYGVS